MQALNNLNRGIISTKAKVRNAQLALKGLLEDKREAKEEKGIGETITREALTLRRLARLIGPSPTLLERVELKAALAVIACTFLAIVYCNY